MKSQGWPPTTGEIATLKRVFNLTKKREKKKKEQNARCGKKLRLYSFCSTGLFGAKRAKLNKLKSVYSKWGQLARSVL